ncbi:NADH:ubiquinone reductase (Na(+)-transporting) subunit F [Betaproteobacteria bacterium PRO7]|jgi:Na+-transporting NADH:ubiquinone oxidoreductase subunit F|nr:NADH:ubiquinone reductase (Na(+)-transporting) subunit F [Burkholderiaceae bacterium]MDL1859669.1 NADH:ubiquinone reductase (Na(+)-transporting) subunit F [Betaproteobacteria bacterium PRO7]GIL06020.1 MAG: Na(+)-translocating NADH-quinone reductase subunit F [Betaproteobacteria bacterium]
MLDIVLAVAMFTAVVLALVAVLLSARRKLVPSGDVSIVINDDPGKALRVEAGGTLLGALAGNQIFIPSACGGKGSCGVCEVIVKEGGGELLPTETGFISPGEARRGLRLACQVKVKHDMKIELAPEVFSVRKWNCRVLSNRNVSTFIKELKLALPEGEDVPFRAGGYVQTECPPHELAYREFDIDPQFREEWDRFDLWRFRSVVDEPVTRAYSMANYPLEKGILMFTIRVAFPPDYREDIPPGKMSSWLFRLKPGDEVTVSGPFGEFFARDTGKEMCFVAAGAGMAPMRSHIFDQLYRLKSRRKMTFWYSARNLKEAFYIEEFDRLAAEHPNFEWHLVLSEPRPEDNWTGPVGLVRHNVLRDLYLKHHPAPEDIEYYLCGPDVMNKAVIRMLLDLGVDRENIMLDDFGL